MKIICEKCNSAKIRKHGFRYNKSGRKQRLQCRECHYLFIIDDGFKKMKHKKEIVVRAIHQYNDGMSLSKIKNHLHQHDDTDISRTCILNWIKKYSKDIKKTSCYS